MKCEKCGTEFQEGIFCPECGNKCAIPEEKTPSVAKEAANSISATAKEGIVTGIRVLGVLVVIALIVFFWHMHWLIPNKSLKEDHIVEEFFTYVYHAKTGDIIYANVIETSHEYVCVRFDFFSVDEDGSVYAETMSEDYYLDGWFRCAGYDTKISATLSGNLVVRNTNGGKTTFKKASKEDVKEYERLDKLRYMY